MMMMAFPDDVPKSPPASVISSHSSHGGVPPPGSPASGSRVARSIRALSKPLAAPAAKTLTSHPASKTGATQSPSATSASTPSTATSAYSVVLNSDLFGTFSEGVL